MAPFHKIHSPGVVVLSPNYPKSYGTNVECQVEIQFPDIMKVSLIFEEFELYQHVDDECGYHWLEIRDGGNTSSPNLRSKLCGDDIPGLIQSSGNMLKIILHSDEHEMDGGFKIRVGAYLFKIQSHLQIYMIISIKKHTNQLMNFRKFVLFQLCFSNINFSSTKHIVLNFSSKRWKW